MGLHQPVPVSRRQAGREPCSSRRQAAAAAAAAAACPLWQRLRLRRLVRPPLGQLAVRRPVRTQSGRLRAVRCALVPDGPDPCATTMQLAHVRADCRDGSPPRRAGGVARAPVCGLLLRAARHCCLHVQQQQQQQQQQRSGSGSDRRRKCTTKHRRFMREPIQTQYQTHNRISFRLKARRRRCCRSQKMLLSPIPLHTIFCIILI